MIRVEVGPAYEEYPLFVSKWIITIHERSFGNLNFLIVDMVEQRFRYDYINFYGNVRNVLWNLSIAPIVVVYKRLHQMETYSQFHIWRRSMTRDVESFPALTVIGRQQCTLCAPKQV